MTTTVLWVRLLGNFMAAINFGAIALALIVFLQRKDIGHRTLLRMIVVFSLMSMGDNLFGAWSAFHHHRQAFASIRLGTAMYGTMCVVYFMATNRDLIRTLRVSEMFDRLRRDNIADREQARQQMVYSSKVQLERSEALLARRT